MIHRWHFWSISGNLTVIHSARATPEERSRALPPTLAAWRLLDVCASELAERRTDALIEMAESSGVARWNYERPTALKEALERAVADGTLLVLEQRFVMRFRATEDSTEPRLADPVVFDEEPTPTELVWIEVVLVDQDDRPIPDRRVEITLPDGSLRRETLDRNGYIRLEGIPRGQCIVRFPDLDGRAIVAQTSQSQPSRGAAASAPRAPAPAPRAPAPPPPRPVAPGPTTWFGLRVVDDVGDAIPGVDIAFGLGGARRIVSTDAAGIARLEDSATSSVVAAIASVDQLREKLGPRWGRPRVAQVPSGPDVHAKSLAGSTESLSLAAEKTTTLAITPHFRCNELAGAHFAFRSSFVLGSAVDTLSVVAAAIVEDDSHRAMVFGHTDNVGSEDVNKELSERRAKALFSILTHDANAWEELWTGSADGTHYVEKWGTKEAQHLLNALGVADDAGEALVEDGAQGPRTTQALKRFQRGDYEGARSGRQPLSETGHADQSTRKELFLSFASLVTEAPVPADRFANIGNAPFMGCGEFNPLSDHGRDEASRRAVIFVFDSAAEPRDLPCALRSMRPCKSAGGVDEAPSDGKPYRCAIYREVAKSCPCLGSEELMQVAVQLHDRQFEPVPDTAYALLIDGTERHHGRTDRSGVLRAAVRKGPVSLQVSYQPPTEAEPLLVNGRVFAPGTAETDDTFLQKLRNLGFFPKGDTESAAIRRFQDAHTKLKRTGRLDEETKEALRRLDDEPLRDAFEDGPDEVGGAREVGGPPQKKAPSVSAAKLAPELRVLLCATLRDRFGSPLTQMKLVVRQQGVELKGAGGAPLVTDAAGRTEIANVVFGTPLEIKLDDQYVPVDSDDASKRYVYAIDGTPNSIIEFQVDDDPDSKLAMVDTKRAYVTWFASPGLFQPRYRFPWQNPIHHEDADNRIYRRRVKGLQYVLTSLFGVSSSEATALDHAGLVKKLVALYKASQATIAAAAASGAATGAVPPEGGTAAEPPPPAPPSVPPAPPSEPGKTPTIYSVERPVPVQDVTPKVEEPKPPPPAPPANVPNAAAPDSAELPRWVWYLLFHHTGLRYSPPGPGPNDKTFFGAHGCYVAPALFLSRARSLEIERAYEAQASSAKPSSADVSEALALIEFKKAAPKYKSGLLSGDDAKTKAALAGLYKDIREAEVARLGSFRTPDNFYDGDFVALGLLKAKRLKDKSVFNDDVWKQVVSRTQLRNDVTSHGWEDVEQMPAALRNFFGTMVVDVTQWRSRRRVTLDTILTSGVCDQTSETGELIRSGNVGAGIPANASRPSQLTYLSFDSAVNVRRGMHFFFQEFGELKSSDQPYFVDWDKVVPSAVFPGKVDSHDPKTQGVQQLVPIKDVATIEDLSALADPNDPSNKAADLKTARDLENWKRAVAEAEKKNKKPPAQPPPTPKIVIASEHAFEGVRFVPALQLGQPQDGNVLVRCEKSSDGKFRIHVCKSAHQEIVVDTKFNPAKISLFLYSTGGGADQNSGTGIRTYDLIKGKTHYKILFGFMHTAVHENIAVLDACYLNPRVLEKT